MDTASIRADWVGRVIDGKFTLLQWLGASGSGGVFLAEVHGLPWKQADVEFIPADAEDAEARIAAWELAAPLTHPHLIRLIQGGRYQIDTAFLIYKVTEHPEEVLSEILPERPLSPAEAGQMLIQVVDALAYLHGKGLVHGHLKPANILGIEDRIKLSSDCLHTAGTQTPHTAAPHAYDAPEIASGPLSPAADIWSLGVTLVEALTQYPVWDRSSDGEPIVQSSIPQPFRDIAQQCLRTDPSRRCTLSEIKLQLQPFSVPAPPAPTEPVLTEPAAEIPFSIPPKHRRPAILAAAFFLVAFITALVWRSHHVHPSPTVPPPSVEIQQSSPANLSPRPRASVPMSRSAKPHPAPPLSRTPQAGAATGEVAEQAMPDLLPRAVQSIHGQINVRVRVDVDSSGNVSSATLDSPGPSKYFAKMSLQAAQNWKFKPAQVNGKAVPSTWNLHFKFKQSGTEITPSQVSP
ncbi:MAG: TonB family protein [Terracidiphilus sp.]